MKQVCVRTQVKLVYSDEFLRKVRSEELKRKMAKKAVNLHQNEYVLHIEGQVIRK